MRRRFATLGEALYLVEHYTLHTYVSYVYPTAYIFENLLQYSASSFFGSFFIHFVVSYLNLEMYPNRVLQRVLSEIFCYVIIRISLL